MVSGNRSLSSDFIFGLIIVVFVVSIIITVLVFFPEGSMSDRQKNEQINSITAGRIIRIESDMISVDTPDGIINSTCGFCFTSSKTNGLCKIDNDVEVEYQKSIFGEYYCIKALIE